MVIFVTGAAGFIGRQVVRELAGRGHHVVAFDLAAGLPADLRETVEFVQGDIGDRDGVCAAVRRGGRVDAIVHLAYVVGTGCENEPARAVHVNVGGMLNVLEAARVHSVRRVIYASSLGTYGPQEAHGDVAVSEDFPDRPVSLYGASKVFDDYLCGHCADLYGFEVVGFRLSVVFGYGRTGGTTGWTSDIISEPALGRPVHLPVRPDQWVSMIYVDDVAGVFAEACERRTCTHRIYNSGGHHLMAAGFADAVRVAVPQAHISFDEQASPMRYAYLIDDARLRSEFKWQRRPLAGAIADQISQARAAHADIRLGGGAPITRQAVANEPGGHQ